MNEVTAYIPEDDSNHLFCPVCFTRMQVMHRHDVEIDYCPDCQGVWLDKGELTRLLEISALPRRVEKRAPQPYVPVLSAASRS